MIKKLLYIFLILLIWATASFAGTSYYCDLSDNTKTSGNAGTFADPFVSLTEVNNKAFSTGDDIYFLKTATYDLASAADRLRIDWSGTDEDRVIVGCYEAEGDFDCGSVPHVDGNRPTITGDNHQYPGCESGSIDVETQQYVTVQDIKILKSGLINNDVSCGGSGAMRVEGSDTPGDSKFITVKNMYFSKPNGTCLLFAKTQDGEITDNYCNESGHPDWTGGGAAIEITGGGEVDTSKRTLIRRNFIANNKSEAIGCYKKSSYCIMEYNVSRDSGDYPLYFGDQEYGIIRYNLIYETDEKLDIKADETHPGIIIQSELNSTNDYETSGYNEIYGNIIVGVEKAIMLSCQAQNDEDLEAVCHEDTKIYNNTLIDNLYSIFFSTAKLTASDGIQIYNNLSWVVTPGMKHTNYVGNIGITWSNNLFWTQYDTGASDPGGSASTNAVIASPGICDLINCPDWRNLKPGDLDGTEAAILSGSAAINAGKNLAAEEGQQTGYNEGIIFSNYTATPIVVTKANDDTSPDIGAWIFGSATAPSVSVSSPAADAEEAGPVTKDFTITCSPACTGQTINLQLGGTATPGSDYVAIASTKVISAGSATITVTPIDDSDIEIRENVHMRILPGTDYTVGADPLAGIGIISDDVPVSNPAVSNVTITIVPQ